MSEHHTRQEAEERGGWRGLLHGLAERLPLGHSHEGHGHDEGPDEALESSEEGIRALKASLIALMLTALLQAVIVAFSGSVALLADTIHNFGDALTAVPLWIAFALARRPATRSYTYGYGRAEDLAGVAIVGVIFFSACVAGYESVLKLVHGSEVSNVGWVATAAIVGFVGNELVARFRISVGKRIGSAALVADGQHARTDGFTSLAVLLGAFGVWLGYPIVDPIVGLGITVAILFIVKDAGVSVWHRMMDSVEPEIVEGIEQATRGVPRVEGIESVRARWVGHRVQGEVAIRVPRDLSIAEVAHVKENLYAAAKRSLPKLEHLAIETQPS